MRQTDFLRGRPAGSYELPDVSWFSPSGGQVEWSGDSRSLVCLLGAVPPDDPQSPPNHHVLMLIHAGTDSRHFVLPPIARNLAWRQFLNTAAESPGDIFPALDGPAPASGVVTMEARSMVVYVARDRSGELPRRARQEFLAARS